MESPSGEKITIYNGLLNVPDNPVIPFIRGDGTGPDIWAASERVFNAAVEKSYPELTVIVAETMVQRQRADLLPFRIGILSLGGLGALGLTLAAVGLYAVVAFADTNKMNLHNTKDSQWNTSSIKTFFLVKT